MSSASTNAGKSSVHSFFQKTITEWANDEFVVQHTVDGFMPSFVQHFGFENDEFHFENYYRQDSQDKGWKIEPIRFEKYLEGPLTFYIPSAWTEIVVKGRLATIGESGAIKQSLGLTEKQTWAKQLPEFFSTEQICAARTLDLVLIGCGRSTGPDRTYYGLKPVPTIKMT